MKVSCASIVVLTFAMGVFSSTAAGQQQQTRDLQGETTGRVALAATAAPPRPPTVRKPRAAKVAPIIKTVIVTPTTGTLSVATEPLTTVIVEQVAASGVKNRQEPLEGTVPRGEGLFIFNKLKPGKYNVTAELKGYKSATKSIDIAPNTPASLTLNLEPITYEVSIETNVSRGEIRYFSKGELPRLVPIRNGRAVIAELRPGIYNIDIRPDEVGYGTLLATIEVEEGKTLFKAELKRLLSKETFSAVWSNLEGWEVPETWRIVSRKLSVNGRGVALPRDESYRHYADFQLSSDAMMVNGVALSFALRALDTKNYYLVQLTGAKADEPYVLRGFLVKNGVAQRLQQSVPIEGFAATIKPQQFFNVSVTAVDNRFNVSITDSLTGDVFPLGVITDPNRNFAVGAVGIAAREGEENAVGTFTVCTPECPKGKP